MPKWSCYFQGCARPGGTREHIPPQSFFPKDMRDQLLTVRSCETHNNKKSRDDIYVLAQICMNASPSSGAREIFMQSIVPQLRHGGGALGKSIAKDAVPLSSGAVQYRVDVARVDRFFDALSCGIVFKACGRSLPPEYRIRHVYHNFFDESQSPRGRAIEAALLDFYSGEPMQILDFGNVKTLNAPIYSAKIFGVPEFRSSITIRHEFYGVFKVTSMLSLIVG